MDYKGRWIYAVSYILKQNKTKTTTDTYLCRVCAPHSTCFSGGQRNIKHMTNLYQKTSEDGSGFDQQLLRRFSSEA